mmetsp:Transcript_85686/g.232227  ORF Transcript_85686/g.232227 Transcript_85686/m.232227 type:complete len:380 (+) Transcript_85686:1330-2469(+)
MTLKNQALHDGHLVGGLGARPDHALGGHAVDLFVGLVLILVLILAGLDIVDGQTPGFEVVDGHAGLLPGYLPHELLVLVQVQALSRELVQLAGRAVIQDAHQLPDCNRCGALVAGDHNHLDAGLVAHLDAGRHGRPWRVEDTPEPQDCKRPRRQDRAQPLFSLRTSHALDLCGGQRPHRHKQAPERLVGQAAILFLDAPPLLLAHFAGHRQRIPGLSCNEHARQARHDAVGRALQHRDVRVALADVERREPTVGGQLEDRSAHLTSWREGDLQLGLARVRRHERLANCLSLAVAALVGRHLERALAHVAVGNPGATGVILPHPRAMAAQKRRRCTCAGQQPVDAAARGLRIPEVLQPGHAADALAFVQRRLVFRGEAGR